MKTLRDFLWSETVHVFFSRPLAGPPDVPADVQIRLSTPDDEGPMLEAFPRVPFRARLDAGDIAFGAWHAGQLVHQSWASTAHAFIPQVNYERPLPEGEVYFYDCVTLPEFRGRGIYPATLSAACRHFRDKGGRSAVLAVLAGNEASMKAVRRAGFAPGFEHRFVKSCGLSWAREAPAGRFP